VKVLHFNVVGTPTDTPVLQADDATQRAVLAVVDEGHATFSCDDTMSGGATVRYAMTREVRVILPPSPGRYEANLPPVRPSDQVGEVVLDYRVAPAAMRIVGDRFADARGWWLLRGSTDFRLGELFVRDRRAFDTLVTQRRGAGANTVRLLMMKDNNTGWAFQWFARAAWRDELLDCCGALLRGGLTPLVTCFADTHTIMPDEHQQRQLWDAFLDVLAGTGVLVQLCNEWNHPTQRLRPEVFPRPTGTLACHGSGLTDADPVSPRWDFACYHARRDALPDARGITNYDCYEFQARYPQPVPLICAEGLKPGNYGFDRGVAALCGRHGGLGAGAFFHTDEGVNGQVWSDDVQACAQAFYQGMGA
jgi:hypothetical protein